jgi:hypothetical protein
MARLLWLILSGAIAGCVAVLAGTGLAGREEAVPATAVGVIALDEAAVPAGPALPAHGAFAARQRATEDAATRSDPFGIESEIERLAAEPSSTERDTKLAALLGQLASLDPRGAVRVAERLRLGDEALSRVFRIWAGNDFDAALAELARLLPPATQRAVALSMLDVVGASEAGIDRLAAGFQPVEALSFRIDAIAKLAERDVEAALAAAAKLETSATQTIAEQRIAAVLAGIDPVRGLEYASTIRIALQRRRFLDRLLDNWAKLDPDAMLAYMETADLTEMAVTADSFRALAASSPEQLLALAEDFAPAQRVEAQRAALQALTALDPMTAYRRVSTLPPSQDRDNFINDVATRYAAQNPEAALAWATTLEPRSSIALNAVLSSVAATDPLRAVNAAIAEILNPAAANTADMPSLAGLLGQAMQAKSPEIARIADLLASHEDPRVAAQLNQIVSRWSSTDAPGALDWTMRNLEHLTASSAGNVAQTLAMQDPARARQALAGIPPDLRASWIAGAAGGMATNDLDGTLRWVEGFRGEAAYQTGVDAALRGAARNQPQAVADYLERYPESRRAVAPMLVSSWAATDPAKAAGWMSALPAAEQAQLGGAASSVAGQWAQRDPRAAETWVLGLPRGGLRDDGLTGLLQQSASQGSVNNRLIDQYSSAEARTRGVASAVFALARTNPSQARELINQHITDPAQRAAAERALESSTALPAGLTLPPGLPPNANVMIRSSGGCVRIQNGVASPC